MGISMTVSEDIFFFMLVPVIKCNINSKVKFEWHTISLLFTLYVSEFLFSIQLNNDKQVEIYDWKQFVAMTVD